MAQNFLADLILNVRENHAEVSKGFADIKNQIGGLNKTFQSVGGYIKAAFAIGGVLSFGKALFDIAGEFDDIGDQLDALGQTLDQNLNASKAKAIAKTFNTDINGVLVAANAASKNFGISMNEALNLVQQGISVAGPKTEKYLKALESQADKFATAGGSASQYFALLSSGFRDSSDWERQVSLGAKATTDTFDSLVGQMTEGQQLQQRLVNSIAVFNTELATLFEGSGDALDSLKVTLYDLATNALRTVKQSVIGLINYFLDLYNNSLAFRLVIQGVVATFKTLWELVKAVTGTLLNGFGAFGDVIKAIFTGNFSEIPNILRNAVNKNLQIFTEAGANIFEAVKNGVETAVKNDPIKLIDENSVLAPTKATGGVVKNSRQVKGTSAPTTISDFGKSALSTDAIKLTTTAAQAFAATQDAINTKVLAGLAEQRAGWQSLGDTISTSFGQTAVNAFTAVGDAITGQKGAFKSLVSTVLDSVSQIIRAYLAEAIAASIKNNAAIPGVGLFLAAGAATAVAALFKAKVPAFKDGGQYQKNTLSVIGEAGPEFFVSNTSGSIISNQKINSLLSGGQKIEIGLSNTMIRGEDLYLVLKEVERRRGL